MITNKAIYNLSKTSTITFFKLFFFFLEIKRKIPSSKVQGITVSKVGSEFVIHVPDEYDYRYASFDK